MIVKAKYHKEIEVTDDITQEEIDRICQHGMPDRFDCMADNIDNEQPLEFDHWEFVEDVYYKPKTPPPREDTREKQKKKDKRSLLISISTAFIFACIFGLAWGIGKHDIYIGLITFTIYLVIYMPVTIAVNWVRKVNKYMEGDRRNV